MTSPILPVNVRPAPVLPALEAFGAARIALKSRFDELLRQPTNDALAELVQAAVRYVAVDQELRGDGQ